MGNELNKIIESLPISDKTNFEIQNEQSVFTQINLHSHNALMVSFYSNGKINIYRFFSSIFRWFRSKTESNHVHMNDAIKRRHNHSLTLTHTYTQSTSNIQHTRINQPKNYKMRKKQKLLPSISEVLFLVLLVRIASVFGKLTYKCSLSTYRYNSSSVCL